MANGIRNADAGEAAMALDRPPHFCISIADGKNRVKFSVHSYYCGSP